MNVQRPAPYSIFKTLRFIGTVLSLWPPRIGASKWVLLIRDIVWILSLVNILFTSLPVVLHIIHGENGIVSLMMAISEQNALHEIVLNLILCRIARRKMQRLIQKVEKLLKTDDESQSRVLMKYVDRYWRFYVFSITSSVSTALFFCCGPIFLPTRYPLEGKYPFSTESTHRRVALYISQVITIMQTGCGNIVDIIVAMFIILATARLEYLGLRLKNVRTEHEMLDCIKIHQDIIRFVEDIEDTLGIIITKTSLTMACTVMSGAFPLVYNQPFTVLLQFCFMVISGCLKLYVTAWPADDLQQMSIMIAVSAYNAKWVESPNISNKVLFMIHRSQKPLVIRMGGLLPALSLEYFSNFLKAISSYFMTMRAAIDK